VYRERRLTLAQFVEVLRRDFAGEEELREWLRHRLCGYGCDDPEVLSVVAAVARMWVDEVARVAEPRPGVRLRPMFHAWLYNLEHGAQTPATPDGRHAGEFLSSDQTPSPGRAATPLEALHSMAQLPHDHTPSGGTTLRLSPDHFAGNDGLARLCALIEGYFAQGGLQLHFILANGDTLRDAIAHPERHQDLLVRVTGFSEHFVRLLPEVQEEMLGRAELSP
jgi:pyruvate-formate lyase